MDTSFEHLLLRLEQVRCAREFRTWVRNDFRKHLPHAALLVTLGNLYGVGSIATHRIDVDFPLTMIEELKNGAGALDDPTMFGWFRNERLRFVDLQNVDELGAQQLWRQILSSYGVREIMIHGVLNHPARRFAVFQMVNPFAGGSPVTGKFFSALVGGMARAAWATVDNKVIRTRQLVGHPTLSLTPTELNIIELLAQGLSNKEIARRRGVSDSTIKTQVQRTGAKVGATRRAEIVAIAMPMLSPLPAQTLLDYDDL